MARIFDVIEYANEMNDEIVHRFPEEGEFLWKMQQADLDYLGRSRAAQTAFAENYVGLPFDG